MSNYDDYDCRECGHRTEDYFIIPGTEEEDKPTCEKCGTTNVARVIAPSSVVFIGTDWDTNTYKMARLKKDPKAHDPMDLVDKNDNPVNAQGERL